MLARPVENRSTQVKLTQSTLRFAKRQTRRERIGIRFHFTDGLQLATLMDESTTGVAVVFSSPSRGAVPGSVLHVLSRTTIRPARATVVRVDNSHAEGVLVGCVWNRGAGR